MYQVGGGNWFFRALVPLEAEEEKKGGLQVVITDAAEPPSPEF